MPQNDLGNWKEEQYSYLKSKPTFISFKCNINKNLFKKVISLFIHWKYNAWNDNGDAENRASSPYKWIKVVGNYAMMMFKIEISERYTVA